MAEMVGFLCEYPRPSRMIREMSLAPLCVDHKLFKAKNAFVVEPRELKDIWLFSIALGKRDTPWFGGTHEHQSIVPALASPAILAS